MKNDRIQIETTEMENRTTNRAKMSDKPCIKSQIAVLTVQVKDGKSDIKIASHLFCITLVVFLEDLRDSFCKYILSE